jgi:hypothetical protein
MELFRNLRRVAFVKRTLNTFLLYGKRFASKIAVAPCEKCAPADANSPSAIVHAKCFAGKLGRLSVRAEFLCLE